MLWIVTQEPKRKHRAGMHVFVQIVEATTRKEALEVCGDNISTNIDFCAPKASKLRVGELYRL